MSPLRTDPLQLGRYALFDEIASGGMATVHVGRLLGPAGFSRTVAIKRLHPHFARDPEFVTMFLDEARLSARIRHPNVVPTLDIVALTGELLLVMEYVEGESLSRLFRVARQASTDIPRAVLSAVLSATLHGLHAAHEATSERGEPLGIVHRDVSPQNVLVDAHGVAKVVDFGIAKAAGRLQVTREGQVKGKTAYMAPEQLLGESVDRRADVYAAAVMLWEGLTLQRLFQSDNDAAVAMQVLEAAVEPPSRVSVDIPPALDAVVMRGLSRDKHARFATAREMAQALEAAVPPASSSDVETWVRSLAGEALKERSTIISEIESGSDRLGGDARASLASLLTPAPRRTADTDHTRTDTELSLTTPAPRGQRARSALPWIIAGAAVLALTVSVGLGLRKESSPAAELSARESAGASPVPLSPATSAAPLASIAPMASIAAPSVASVAPPLTTAPPVRPPPGRPPATPKEKRVGCNPPYTVDASGVHVMKPACL